MAAPTVNVTRPYNDFSLPFAKRQWGTNLWDTRSDDYYTTVRLYGHNTQRECPKPGELRYHDAICGRGPYSNIYAQGPCWFRWVLNRSGGALAQFSLASQPANSGTLTVVSGTVSSITDTAQFTALEERHAIAHIIDDVGGLNAAPEGQWGYIVYNDANVIYFQPDMTVAPAVGDTYDIWYPYNLEASADGDLAQIVQGVVVSADGIADNYWGWVLVRGFVSAASANALTAGQGIVADAGAVGASGGDTGDLIIGYSPYNYQAACAQAGVYIDVLTPHFEE